MSKRICTPLLPLLLFATWGIVSCGGGNSDHSTSQINSTSTAEAVSSSQTANLTYNTTADSQTPAAPDPVTDSGTLTTPDTNTMATPDPVPEDDVAYMETFKATDQRELAPVVEPAELQAVSASSAYLAELLYHDYSQDNSEADFAFSSYDLVQILAMIATEASGNTLDAVLNQPSISLTPERLHPAVNAVNLDLINRNGAGGFESHSGFWGQERYKFSARFLEALAKNYGPDMQGADFLQAADIALTESSLIRPWYWRGRFSLSSATGRQVLYSPSVNWSIRAAQRYHLIVSYPVFS